MDVWVGLIIALAAICTIIQYKQIKGNTSTTSTATSRDFAHFQQNYLIVFLIMMAADWLQGPYVYALYHYYNFSREQIAILFIAGFGSSMVMGTFVGSLADRYGRKRNCIVYGIVYAASCLTKHFPDFFILMLGRLLGGIATSILYSAFESWLVFEHHHRNYPSDWLALTFSRATFGNGIAAILAGIVAYIVSKQWGMVAPFDTSFLFLMIGTIIVYTTWTENYGDVTTDMGSSWRKAVHVLLHDEKVVLLGVIQSAFEGAMYTFVFMWTPTLQDKVNDLPHGLLFSAFMLCIMIGSSIFKSLVEITSVESMTRWVFAVGCLCMFVPVVSVDPVLLVFAFLVFEICVGMFWPALGTMRGNYVPEEVRATLMNVFRIPLNLFVVLILINVGDTTPISVPFKVCTGLLLGTFLCQLRLYSITRENFQLVSQGDMTTEMEPATGVGDGDTTV
eukprot:TRINITY_DN37604_c0_g1_i1.p2 TRINITY_DN37604_c0_g1~~TRINITY_DN37604_c0_g1_i1.p2  ORF type:complete len:457 (+),score=92.75 TRINITY_DN37604_c0_g1_i1:25-1371(+)